MVESAFENGLTSKKSDPYPWIWAKINIRFFYAFGICRETGWDQRLLDPELQWKTFRSKLKEREAISDWIGEMFEEFWKFSLDPIKKRFGLLKAESDPEKPTSDDEKI